MGWSAPLVDMENDDETKIDTAYPIDGPSMKPKAPDYPWGLRISLTHRELKKLGLEADCSPGDMIDLRCFATVRSVSKNTGSDGETCCVELQIEKMSAEDEMKE
jgi:hypothetical protein